MKTSREMAVMIGRIITASTTPTVSVDRPDWAIGTSEPNSGMNPRFSRSHGNTLRAITGASTVMPHSP